MKVVFLSDDFPPQSYGGAGISTYELARGIQECGHQISVVTTCRQRKDAGAVEDRGITIYKIATNYHPRWRAYVSLYNPPVVREVEKLLQEIKPDIVHVHNIHQYLSYSCLKVARQYARGVLWTARDVMAFNFGKLTTKRYLAHFDYRTNWFDHLKQAKARWNPLRNFFIKRYLTYAHRRLAVSWALQQALVQNGIRNVSVLYTGVGAENWHITDVRKQQFHTKYGLMGKKIIFFGGRLSEAKGANQALEMLSEVVKTIPNTVLLIGSQLDNYAKVIQDRANSLGLKDNLVFAGWLTGADLKAAYACADVVLVPSVCFDSLPRIVLEAMAAGRPVVTTVYGGAQEAVQDGITGYVVNPFKTKIMAEKVIDILQYPNKAASFGEAGQERIKTAFNLQNKVAELVTVYEELLHAK